MMCLSNLPARFFLLFGVALTIGTTNAISQAPASRVIEVENCHVNLIDSLDLAAPVPGVLEFVTPELGDTVAAGDIIAGLKSEVVKAQKAIALKEAQNDVEIRYARKAAELADAEWRKALEANRRLGGTVAQVEIERLKLASERAHLQIEQAEHQLAVAALKAEEAEANFQIYQVPSKIRGIVTDKNLSPGEAVRQGDVILKIENIDRVHVEGLINVPDRFSVKRGDKVRVRLNVPGLNLPKEHQQFEGVIKLVDVSVEIVRQKVRVVAEVQNPHGVLGAGVPVTMTILPGTSGEVQTTLLGK